MIQRCTIPEHPYYPDYGGRGIRVCEEWLASPLPFYQHIGPKPGRGYSLDRIDNNRGYEPGNVRWATQSMQLRNTRRSKLTELDVKFVRLWRERGYTYAEVAEAFGCGKSTIWWNTRG